MEPMDIVGRTKEDASLPKDVRVARDAQDLLIDCSDESPRKIRQVMESSDEDSDSDESPRKIRQVMESSDEDSDAADESSSEEVDDNWIQEQWNPMVEIFSILYLDTDVVNPQNQLGRIYMDTHVGILDICNLDKVDKTRETIEHGDEFDIMDMKGPIPFNKGGCLKFDLFRGAYKGSVYDIFRDVQFFSRDDAKLKNISLDRFDGTGKVVVFMGLYAHATVARVEVRLNASVAANVYGTVSACNTRINDISTSSFLFLKEEERKIILGTDCLIPLSRSRVAVPVEFVFCLDFSLVVDGKHLETTMSFYARKAGVSTKTRKSLSVTVHWDTSTGGLSKESVPELHQATLAPHQAGVMTQAMPLMVPAEVTQSEASSSVRAADQSSLQLTQQFQQVSLNPESSSSEAVQLLGIQ